MICRFLFWLCALGGATDSFRTKLGRFRHNESRRPLAIGFHDSHWLLDIAYIVQLFDILFQALVFLLPLAFPIWARFRLSGITSCLCLCGEPFARQGRDSPPLSEGLLREAITGMESCGSSATDIYVLQTSPNVLGIPTMRRLVSLNGRDEAGTIHGPIQAAQAGPAANYRWNDWWRTAREHLKTRARRYIEFHDLHDIIELVL